MVIELASNGYPRIGFCAMPEAQYHADPCVLPSLSQSMAHILATKSPMHAHWEHPRLGGNRRTQTKAMGSGNIRHAILLGTAEESLVVVKADDFRTKAARELRDEALADGKTPVLERDLAEHARAAFEILAQLEARGVRFTGMSEVCAFWVEHAEDGTEVQCRSRMDHVDPSAGIIYDMKNTQNAHASAIRRSIEGYGYDIQQHAYRRALECIEPELVGRSQFKWLFAESEGPWAVNVAEASGSMETLGAMRWQRAVNLWAACMKSGKWPGYTGVARIEASPWSLEGETAMHFEEEAAA